MISLLLFAALFAFFGLALFRAGVPWMDAAVAAFVWIWADLVIAANVLSPFGLLGHRFAYAAVVIGLAAGSWFAIRGLARLRPLQDVDGLLAPSRSAAPGGGADRVLFIASVTFLVLGLLWHLLAALTIEPSNPDTLMYRLPRIWWYLAQGNLRHFADSVDPRVVFYPFNVSLGCLPLALYGAAPIAFNLPSVAAWAVAAVVVFRLAQWMGASRGVAAFVAFLIAFAPIVFVEATSTNDEIIAAAGLVAGIYFFLRYFRGGSRLDLGTAALALGCGLGSKLHFFFFWPAVIVLGLWLGLCSLRDPVLRRFVMNGKRLRDVAAAIVIAFVLSVPFLIYNRVSSPHFAYSGDEARNSPFSTAVASQTLSLLTGQLFLSPFPTFDATPKNKVRQARIAAWNAWWNERLYRNVDQSKRHTYATYQFLGVTDPKGGQHFENTEWAGLLPWLFVVCGCVLVVRPTPHRWLAASLAIALLAWWLAYCATMKYFDTVGVYFAYPLIICGAFITAALMPGRARFLTWMCWGMAAIVAIGNLALCWNIISFNPHFSYHRVVAALKSGVAVDASSPRFGLGPALAGLDRATILLTHWAVPYYEIIKTSPGTSYFITNPGRPVRGATLAAVQANSFFDGYLPVKVSVPQEAGLVYLDTIRCSYGPELIFGDATFFRSRIPAARSRYLVFKAMVDETVPSARALRISSQVLGNAGLEKDLKYRMTMLVPGQPAKSTGWLAGPAAEFPIGDAAADGIRLQVEVASADGAKIGDATFQPFLPQALKKYNDVVP